MNAVLWKALEKAQEETRQKDRREFAKRLLAKGMDLDDIVDLTGLSRDEIRNIRDTEIS